MAFSSPTAFLPEAAWAFSFEGPRGLCGGGGRRLWSLEEQAGNLGGPACMPCHSWPSVPKLLSGSFVFSAVGEWVDAGLTAFSWSPRRDWQVCGGTGGENTSAFLSPHMEIQGTACPGRVTQVICRPSLSGSFIRTVCCFLPHLGPLIIPAPCSEFILGIAQPAGVGRPAPALALPGTCSKVLGRLFKKSDCRTPRKR